IRIAGKQLTVTNLKKVLYPTTGFTKADIINYYVKAASVLLPHLKRRALTLKRYPQGVNSGFFYEKRCPSYHPDWISTSEKSKGPSSVEYCVVNNVPALVWVANLASIELHTLLSYSDNLEEPTMVMFDLDPGPSKTLIDCAMVAVNLRK